MGENGSSWARAAERERERGRERILWASEREIPADELAIIRLHSVTADDGQCSAATRQLSALRVVD